MKTNLFNIKSKKKIRRDLRKPEIACESILWQRLRNRQLGGFKFRRQFGIGNYIVDFYCPELRLVIEIDGATHSTDKEFNYDNKRQSELEELRLKVKRYNNIDVKENIEALLSDIYDTCRIIEKNKPHPNPLLLKERG